MDLAHGRRCEALPIGESEVEVVEVAGADLVSPIAGRMCRVEELVVAAQRRGTEVGAENAEPSLGDIGERGIGGDAVALVEHGGARTCLRRNRQSRTRCGQLISLGLMFLLTFIGLAPSKDPERISRVHILSTRLGGDCRAVR